MDCRGVADDAVGVDAVGTEGRLLAGTGVAAGMEVEGCAGAWARAEEMRNAEASRQRQMAKGLRRQRRLMHSSVLIPAVVQSDG